MIGLEAIMRAGDGVVVVLTGPGVTAVDCNFGGGGVGAGAGVGVMGIVVVGVAEDSFTSFDGVVLVDVRNAGLNFDGGGCAFINREC